MALYHKIWCIIIEKLTILFDERLKQSEDDTLETGFGRADVGQGTAGSGHIHSA